VIFAMSALESQAARTEAWVWWMVICLGLLIALFLWVAMRWRGTLPMHHRPSDTTDAWREAGRRLQVPEDEDGRDEGEERP